MNRDALLLSYLADELDPTGLQQVELLLEDPEARVRLVELSQDEVAIAAWFDEQTGMKEARATPQHQPTQTISSRHRPVPAPARGRSISGRRTARLSRRQSAHRRTRPPNRNAVFLSIMAATALSLLVVVFALVNQTTQTTPDLAPTSQPMTVQPVEPVVAPAHTSPTGPTPTQYWTVASGAFDEANAPTMGDRLANTTLTASEAVLLTGWHASTIKVSQGSRLHWSNGSFELLTGSMDCSITPGGRGLTIKTPHAAVTVRGTKYHVVVDDYRTSTTVDEGLVQMNYQGAIIDIPAEHWSASDLAEFRAHPIPPGGLVTISGLLPVDSHTKRAVGKLITTDVISVPQQQPLALTILFSDSQTICAIRFPDDFVDISRRPLWTKGWALEHSSPFALFGNYQGSIKPIHSSDVPADGLPIIIQPLSQSTRQPNGLPRHITLR